MGNTHFAGCNRQLRGSVRSEKAAARGNAEQILSRGKRDARVPLVCQLGEEGRAAEKLHQGSFALADLEARIERRAVAGVGDLKLDPSGACQVVEIAALIAARGE